MDKKKILIIDDEKELIDVMELRLRASGYDVVSAVDGESGIAKARREKPDLILLDVVMPKMDGLTVCKTLRADAAFARTPIVLLTAKDQGAVKDTLTETKADLILMKPFDPHELLGTLKKLIKKTV